MLRQRGGSQIPHSKPAEQDLRRRAAGAPGRADQVAELYRVKWTCTFFALPFWGRISTFPLFGKLYHDIDIDTWLLAMEFRVFWGERNEWMKGMKKGTNNTEIIIRSMNVLHAYIETGWDVVVCCFGSGEVSYLHWRSWLYFLLDIQMPVLLCVCWCMSLFIIYPRKWKCVLAVRCFMLSIYTNVCRLT